MVKGLTGYGVHGYNLDMFHSFFNMSIQFSCCFKT